MIHEGISETARPIEGYPYNDELRRIEKHDGHRPEPKRRVSEKIRSMVNSALIFITAVAWSEWIREYLLYLDFEQTGDLTDILDDASEASTRVDTTRKKTDQVRQTLQDRLSRRGLFAAVITVITFFVVWWLA